MAAAAAAATAKAAEEMVEVLDEETLALMGVSSAATAAPVAVGAEWETFKENVRPLKRGRDVSKLNHALKAHADPAQRAALLETRKCVGFVWSEFLDLGPGSLEETSCCSNANCHVCSSFG
jgi:checkpoint serine/threonine-protein kinase